MFRFELADKVANSRTPCQFKSLRNLINLLKIREKQRRAFPPRNFQLTPRPLSHTSPRLMETQSVADLLAIDTGTLESRLSELRRYL